eukprot:TRINITY_DN60834_c0_g1_i1.p1 TRINITY_DN60834_c0_g1~~TRINITY_DN60834_c0_g1_i1.p1  ORF type:complete len:314 (-),score=30.33 TRINITY_DN60834_c0_g1_i1:132-1043(-)
MSSSDEFVFDEAGLSSEDISEAEDLQQQSYDEQQQQETTDNLRCMFFREQAVGVGYFDNKHKRQQQLSKETVALTPEQIEQAKVVKARNISKLQQSIDANVQLRKKLEEKLQTIQNQMDESDRVSKQIMDCYNEYTIQRHTRQTRQRGYYKEGAGQRSSPIDSFWVGLGFVPDRPPGSEVLQEIMNSRIKQRLLWTKAEEKKLEHGLWQFAVVKFQNEGIRNRDRSISPHYQLIQQNKLIQDLRKLSLSSERVLNYIDNMQLSDWENMISQYCSWRHSAEDCLNRWTNYVDPRLNKTNNNGRK